MIVSQPSGATVLRPTELPTHERGGGARTTPLVTRAIGSTSFITGITEFDPGVAIPFHRHNCQESVMLLEGSAMLDIDGVELPLVPHDCTFIPAGADHRFRNLSRDKPMKILWIYASPEATRTLSDSGATSLVALEHQPTTERNR
jgi:mannose-6-phosphate isomerase-like protein (cupin superfamily)